MKRLTLVSYMAGTWAVSYAVGSLAAGTALLIDKTDEWWGWKDALKQALYD